MTASTVSRSTIIQDTGYEQGDLVTGTATGGTTTTLVDASASSPFSAAHSSSKFVGQSLYLSGGSNAGTEHLISAYSPSTRTVTTADAFANANASTDTYEIWKTLTRADRNRALNRVLTERMAYKTYAPLTLVPNGDFELGTANWTATNATFAVVTGAANVTQGVDGGSVTATSAGGYTQSDAIPVSESTAYRWQVYVREDTSGSSPLFAVYDLTHGQLLTVSGTTSVAAAAGGWWKRLSGTFTIPTGCVSIAVRLVEQTNGATSYWDDIFVVPLLWRRLQAPDWLQRPDQLEWVWWKLGSDTYAPEVHSYVPLTNCQCLQNTTAGRSSEIEISPDGIGQFLYVSGFRYYGALASDSATTTAPEDWVRAELGEELIRLKWRAGAYPDRKAYEADLSEWGPLVRETRRRYKPKREYQPLRFPLRGY